MCCVRRLEEEQRLAEELEQKQREEEELRLAEEARQLEHERYLCAVKEQERKRKEEEERLEIERREVGNVTINAVEIIYCFSNRLWRHYLHLSYTSALYCAAISSLTDHREHRTQILKISSHLAFLPSYLPNWIPLLKLN